jgi:UPF0716 family protein affecting phage T7 exclusion
MKTVHMSRTPRAYLVFENELSSLSALDAVLGFCSTLIMFSFSMVGSSLWDLGYTPPGADAAVRGEFGWGWLVFWLVFAAMVGVVMWRVWVKRGGIVAQIKDESSA